MQPIMADERDSVTGPVLLLILMVGCLLASPFLGMILVFASDSCTDEVSAFICTPRGQTVAGLAPAVGAAGGIALALLALLHRPLRFLWSALSFIPPLAGIVTGLSIAAAAP